MINERDNKIQKINEDNNIIKKDNINSTNNCAEINDKINIYKKHILLITEQNGKLSQELENILNRDIHCNLPGVFDHAGADAGVTPR